MSRKKKKRRTAERLMRLMITGVLVCLAVVLGLLVATVFSRAGHRVFGLHLSVSYTPSPSPRPTRSPVPVEVDYTAVHDMRLNVYFHDTGKIVNMPLEEYMIHVVAGEVPASYPMEAIKAQALAARSYTLYTIRHGGCAKHKDEGADICTDSGCCQSYKPEIEMLEEWDEYPYYYSVVCKAVMDTAGEVMLSGGKPIDALYHSASGGRTEDSEHVYKNKVKYLRSVESPFEDDKYNDVKKTFTRAAFCEKINALYPKADLSPEKLEEQVRIESTYESGRVETIRLGGTSTAGTKIRKSLTLLSTLFTIEFTPEDIVFHTWGNGHGVGLSQYGANGMARQGYTYKEILSHYYTGVRFGVIGQY